MMAENYFVELNNVDVSKYIEKKNGLSYLAWANAWAEVKKRHPDAFYTIYENVQGWLYHTDGHTCWVKTGVTINGLEHIEYLPVMDFRNKSIPADNVTSFDVNKAIQRSLTKACARHGLGLYVYAGEDLPEVVADEKVAHKNALYIIEGDTLKLKNSKGAFVEMSTIPDGALKALMQNPSYSKVEGMIKKYLESKGAA